MDTIADPLLAFAAQYAIDFGRYALVAGPAFIIFWIWGRERFRRRRIQARRPSRARMREDVAYSLGTAAVFTAVTLGIMAGASAGLFRRYEGIGDYGIAYFACSIVALIVIQDTYFYWTHRLMHHRFFFGWMHAVHHRSASPSPWTAYAFAPAEALVHALVVPLVWLVLPLHDAAAFLFLLFMILRNVLGHLGIELLPERFVQHRLGRHSTTTVHHDLHHRDSRYDFGLYFTFWDRRMGTTHPQYEAEFARVTSRSAELRRAA